MRKTDINSGGLQRGPVRGAGSGGGHKSGVKFVSGQEGGTEMVSICMMGQTDCINLLCRCVSASLLPPLKRSLQSCCLHCVNVLRYHISMVWCSSLCVDIHINYPDCSEHLSGLSTIPSIVPRYACRY